METRVATFALVLLVAIADSVAAAAITVPLAWVDRQAYVANFTIDGTARPLQVGTIYSTVWVTCKSTDAGICSPGMCDWRVETETSLHCATIRNVTLSVGENETLAEFPLRVAQYHELLASENRSMSSSGEDATYPFLRSDYSKDQPPLVSGSHGSIGLGRGVAITDAAPSSRSMIDIFQNFSLYLSTDQGGVGSFLCIGGDQAFDTSLQIASGWTGRYSLSVQSPPSHELSEEYHVNRWDIGLAAVRFGDATPLYPRTYESWEDPGTDVSAALSLNHAVIEMPQAVLQRFYDAYLTSCSLGKNKIGNTFYKCAASVMEKLPRVGLYVESKVFYLDPVDYTHVLPSNSSNIIVELGMSDHNTHWVLGAPFLRKFPSHFSLTTLSITLFCKVGSTCRSQPVGSYQREAVNMAATPSPTPVPTNESHWPGTTHLSTQQRSAFLVALWMIKFFAALILAGTVVRLFQSWRDRRRGYRREDLLGGDDGIKTVASERDIEEVKEELRRMVAEEQAERRQPIGTSFDEDDHIEYRPIRSPRTPL